MLFTFSITIKPDVGNSDPSVRSIVVAESVIAPFKVVDSSNVENEVIEYTGRSSNQLTGCTRGTSAPYRGVSPESTVASSHSNLAKVFGSYKVASLNTTQVRGTGQPEFSTQFDGINVTLVNTASSTETGGGLQCTIGPINDRA